MKPINAGEFSHWIEIRRPESAKNAAGYGSGTNSLVCRRRARVTRTSGTELVKANADFGQEKVRFLIRYTTQPIDRKMFVRWRGLDYEIEYINDYAGRRYIEIWGVRQTKEGA